jgi:hypothetical protein
MHVLEKIIGIQKSAGKVRKCLFPIYAYMVSCAQRSKNLERHLLSTTGLQYPQFIDTYGGLIGLGGCRDKKY